MKKVTKEWLIKKNACCSDSDKERAEKEGKGDIHLIVTTLIKENRLSDGNWLMANYMTHYQRIKYAVFAAKQVLINYEKRFPGDCRPRKAIEAVENYLENPSKKNKESAAESARSAWSAARYAESVDESAAWSAAWSAARSAESVDESADESAAWSTAESAAESAAEYVAESAGLKAKIIKNGLKIIEAK